MKKLTVIFLCLLLASTALGCGKKNGIRATYAGNINTYCEMKDGTWSCNDRSYEYRLERRGRLPSLRATSIFRRMVSIISLPVPASNLSGLSVPSTKTFYHTTSIKSRMINRNYFRIKKTS